MDRRLHGNKIHPLMHETDLAIYIYANHDHAMDTCKIAINQSLGIKINDLVADMFLVLSITATFVLCSCCDNGATVAVW